MNSFLKYVRQAIAGTVLLLLANSACAAPHSWNCPDLSGDAEVRKVVARLLEFETTQQGKMNYNAKSTATHGAGLVRNWERSTDGMMFGYDNRPQAYLLVKRAGLSEPFAIEINQTRPFVCFARPGDNIELRNNFGVVHWTTLKKVDTKAGRVEILDSWPSKFAFLASNSGGLYHGSIERRDNKSIIVMPIQEVDDSLVAIITSDRTFFASALISCNCVTSSAGRRALVETLLTSGSKDAFQEAAEFSNSWPKSDTRDSVRVAYLAASIYIAGAYDVVPNKEQALNQFVKLFSSSSPETLFSPLTPASKLVLLNSIPKASNPVAQSVLASLDQDLAAKRLSSVQTAQLAFYKARLYEVSNNTLAAKLFKDAITVLAALQATLSKTLSHTNSVMPEYAVARDELYSVVRMRASAHRALVEYYIQANEPEEAGKNYEQLRDDLPTPPGELILLAARGCSAFNKPIGLRDLNRLNPQAPEKQVRDVITSVDCFSPQSRTEFCKPEVCVPELRWAVGRWDTSDLVSEGGCNERGVLNFHLVIRDGDAADGRVGELEINHFSPDPCYDEVDDLFSCTAKYNLAVVNATSQNATLAGDLETTAPCSKEQRNLTPIAITATIGRRNDDGIDLESTLSGSWDPFWFTHRIEKLAKSNH